MASNATIFSDFTNSFGLNPITQDLNRAIDENSISQSLKNLIRLEQWEKPFRPNLFCGLKRELFELITPITQMTIQDRISNIIRYHEPRVDRHSVEVVGIPEENGYVVKITFTSKKSIDPTVVTFFLERTL